MTDPIVTHADLPTLRALRDDASCDAIGTDALLDRLIAAAEADAPPLPEGWVVYTYTDGAQDVLWHIDGALSRYSDSSGEAVEVEHPDRLTPLRPTITEADVEKAAIAYMSNGEDTEWHPDDSDNIKKRGRYVARLMLAAAGIEVTP